MSIGLCINCDHSPTCNWKKDNIILCGEHQLTAPAEISTQDNTSPPIFYKVEYGICSTCSNFQDCSLRKNNHQIIFCEEYL